MEIERTPETVRKVEFSARYEGLFSKPPQGVRYVVVTGGRDSGKSYTISAGVASQVNNFRHRALYARLTLTSAEDSIIPEFTEKLDLLGIGKYYTVRTDRILGPGGRKVVFRGLRTTSGEQSAKMKSLKDFSCFVLDEAEEVHDEEDFDKIDLSIRPNDVQSLIIIVLNPSDKSHWVYKRFFENAGVPEGYYCLDDPEPYRVIGDTMYIHSTYLDNWDNIPDDYKKIILKMKDRDPERFKHVFLGKWDEVAEGVIFTNWRFSKPGEVDWDTIQFDGFGLDFGFRDPDALVGVKVDHKQRRIYARQMLYRQGLSDRELAYEVSRLTGRQVTYGDKAASKSIRNLRGYGVNIKEGRELSKGRILDDVKVIKGYEIIISPDSKELANELKKWVWLDKVAEKTSDNFCHLLDAFRYICRNIILPGGGYQGIKKCKIRRK